MLLGIDYGEKRIGLALAPEQGPAVPWQIIDFVGLDKTVKTLAEIVQEQQVSLIVIGMPTSLAGKLTERSAMTDQFVQSLKQAINLPVVLEDERMTSAIITKATGESKNIDAKSAAEILQTYLDRKNALH